MRRKSLAAILTLAVLTGCHSASAPTSKPAKVAAPGEHDKLWVSKAYQFNIYQIEAGRIASSRSTTDRVRNLAHMMSRDYAELGGQIEAHAEQHHLLLPPEMDEAHATYLQKLSDVPPGPDFDRSYLNLQLKTHYELASLYEDEANNGEYPGTRAVAQDALPDIYAHLRHIQQLRPGTWTAPTKPTTTQKAP